MDEGVTSITSTNADADLPPALAVTVEVPPFRALTLPLPSTVATPGSELSQVTVLSDASAGLTVAVSLAVPPTVRSILSLSSVTELTLTVGFTTVMAQEADLLPADAVILAEPTATAVTSPVGDTVATEELDEVHVTVLSVASAGDTVAVNRKVSPTVSSAELLLRDTDDTATSVSVGPHASSRRPMEISAIILFILMKKLG